MSALRAFGGRAFLPWRGRLGKPPLRRTRVFGLAADAQLLAVHQAGAFGPRLVLVVGVFLQMLLAEASLLLVVRLLLQISHGFPA